MRSTLRVAAGGRARKSSNLAAMRRLLPPLCVAIASWLLVGVPSAAYAQAWNGSVSNLWSNQLNWTPHTVPNTLTATAVITTATNNPVLIDVNPTLGNLTIGAAESATLSDGQSLTIFPVGSGFGTMSIAGTLTLQSAGADTRLILNGASTITLSGGGTLALSNDFGNTISGNGISTLVNSAGNKIQGSGRFGISNAGGFGFTLKNHGIINANQSVELAISPGGPVTTNDGTLEATGGGVLILFGEYNNAGGLIQATGANSLVVLAGIINGGTLTTTTGGTFSSEGAILDGVANTLSISSGSTVTAKNGEGITLRGTIAISSGATLAANSTGSSTGFGLVGAVTLTGGGTLALSNNANNIVASGVGTPTLVNSAGNTIQGSGQFGAGPGANIAFTLTNHGIINANQSVALQVNPGTTATNDGTLEATSGGTLDLIGTYNNAGGLIQATGANSVVDLSGSTINGGTLTTTTGGAINNNQTATLNGVTLSDGTTVTNQDGRTITLLGTITINSTATLQGNSIGSDTDFVISGAVTLAGGGALSLSNTSTNRVYGTNAAADSLTNAAGNTIQGSGQLGLGADSGLPFALTNHGIINSNQSPLSTLGVNPGSGVTNDGTLEATNGGILYLLGTFNNAGGLIQATGASSVVEINGSTINGGMLTTASGGEIDNSRFEGSATLNGVTISSGSTVNCQNNTTTTLQGNITINSTATLAENAYYSPTNVQLSGSVTLSGGGTFSLSDDFNNRVYGINGGSDTLLNSAGNTIQGSGQFGIGGGGNGFTLTNNGTMLANQTNPLQVDTGNPVTNNGTLQANPGSTLQIIDVLTNYNAGTLSGGTYQAFSGTIRFPGAAIATNAATILLDATSGTPQILNEITNTDALQNTIAANAPTGSLTIQNGVTLNTSPGGFGNSGTVVIGANSSLNIGAGGYSQASGSTSLTTATSRLEGPSAIVTITGGTLQGIGTVDVSEVINLGTVHPGNSPGILTDTGNYVNNPPGILDIEIGGPNPGTGGYSQLNVGGTAALGGTLDLTLVNGFIPTNGETFTILNAGGGILGRFATVNGLNEGGVTFQLTYQPGDVLLTAQVASAVPEPASGLLILLAAPGLLAALRLRKR